MRSREEIIPQNAELLVASNLKAIATSDKLVPSEKEVQNIVAADAKQQTVADILATQNEAFEDVKKTLIAQGLGHLANNLPFAKPTFLEQKKDKTFHFLPYRFDSNFERKFLESVLEDADFERLNLEIFFNGEDNLTEFKIDCYKKQANKQWRKLGGYYPDFLIFQRNADNKIHKALIIETKGEGFAAAFSDKKAFMETEFIPLNNEQFGYNRFDFLYIQDDDATAEQTLNEKLKDFFQS